jgi:2-oxoglutarate decarboxylase
MDGVPGQTIVKVTLPEMGESVTEGSVVEWRVTPGQWIEQGETLVDVTTDKVDVEVPAPASGVVTSVQAAEGATVAVGAVLAEIDTAAPKPNGVAVKAGVAPKAAAAPAIAAKPSAPASNGAGSAERAVSQRARRIADRAHFDLSQVAGSGPNGLISRRLRRSRVPSPRSSATWNRASRSRRRPVSGRLQVGTLEARRAS